MTENKKLILPGTGRIEAFSDGVIAIIITIMVLELKIPELQGKISSQQFWNTFLSIVPKLMSYVLSFTVVAIMWVNHHQIMHMITKTDGKLLWYNVNLLFWMSLIPLSTALLGSDPLLPETCMIYGFVLFMSAFSFTLMRGYASGRGNLMRETISGQSKRRANQKNFMGNLIYFISIFAGFVSPYIAFACFIIVPIMYFVPEKIEEE